MKNFFKTVAIVTCFSACEKFLGFLYRIFLSRTIGTEGIGLYQVALSVFAMLFTFSCSGTPITVSRLMTKYKAEGRSDKVQRIISAGLFSTILIVIPLCLIFYFFSNKIDFLFADVRCKNIFLIMLPGLVFTSIYSILRGVFWGNKDFLPYSIIELLEEICMIVVGIVLITNASTVYDGAYSCGVAVLVSYIFSFSLGTFVFFFRKNRLVNPKKELKPLLSSAMPITAMRSANSLITSLVSIILPIRLMVAGYSSSGAMSVYGAAVGQTLPILYIPSTLIGSFILVLTPLLSENFYSGKTALLKEDIEKSIKFTAFISCLFIPIFFVCGEEIGVILFGESACGKYLMISSYLTIFIGLSTITTSMLNSIGMETKTLIYFIIGALLMLLSVFILPKFCGIYAIFIGLAFVYGFTAIMNLILINKKCALKPKYLKFIFILLLITLPTILLGLMLEKLLLSLLGSILTTIVVCGTMVIFSVLFSVGFNLVCIKVVLDKIKFLKRKKPLTKS